ncbi:hypothetical protein Peur_033408 [Populus x canadensis]
MFCRITENINLGTKSRKARCEPSLPTFLYSNGKKIFTHGRGEFSMILPVLYIQTVEDDHF